MAVPKPFPFYMDGGKGSFKPKGRLWGEGHSHRVDLGMAHKPPCDQDTSIYAAVGRGTWQGVMEPELTRTWELLRGGWTGAEPWLTVGSCFLVQSPWRVRRAYCEFRFLYHEFTEDWRRGAS